MSSTIDKIQRRLRKIASGKDRLVKPGQPERFSEACVQGDYIRQGDLYLIVVNSVPEDYVRVIDPKEIDRQLVPGNTQGSKHCLDSLVGIDLFRPKNWNEEKLEGPAFRCFSERTILHPTHGSVTVLAGMVVRCHYQREFDREMQKERRAKD